MWPGRGGGENCVTFQSFIQRGLRTPLVTVLKNFRKYEEMLQDAYPDLIKKSYKTFQDSTPVIELGTTRYCQKSLYIYSFLNNSLLTF